MARFIIRTMIPDDLSEILEISTQCGLSYWSRNDYLDEAQRSDSIMLSAGTEGSGIAGFLVSRFVPGTSMDERMDAEVYNIGVRPELQKSGCGTLLFDCFLNKCRAASIETVWLDVRSSNEDAIAFYRKFGFTEFSLRKAFYGDPVEDGIVMNRIL